jgi:hypothetical protein
VRVWSVILTVMLVACAGGGAGMSALAPAVSVAVATPAPVATPTVSPANATITVNFARPRTQVSMSGFLNGQLQQRAVPSSLIAPLDPGLWRGSSSSDPGDDAKLHAMFPSMTYVDVLSDDYGYPDQGTWNAGGSLQAPFGLAPYAGGAAAWSARVTASVAALCAHSEVVYEEWNEPDVSGLGAFFYGTEAQADATQAAAYAATIKTCPGSLSGAPATVLYDKTFIVDYLQYCLANGCQVNFISFHDDNDGNIPQVAVDLQDARASLLQSSTYAALHIAKIYDDESVGPTANRNPGDVVAYLYYLEAGGADGAAKACWTSPAGASECFDGSVDGIIDPGTEQPRAVWWSYKYYADGVASRVASSTVDPGIVAVASSASATGGSAQVLVGAIDVNGRAPSTGTPTIALQGLTAVPALAGLTAVIVRTTPIAATGTTPVATLPAATSQVVAVVNGTAAFALTLAPHAAALVTISAK